MLVNVTYKTYNSNNNNNNNNNKNALISITQVNYKMSCKNVDNILYGCRTH